MLNKRGNRPKIGVIIGGGGIKSFGANCLFEALDDRSINIDFLGGCSGGAFVSAARAFGPNKINELTAYFEKELKAGVLEVDCASFLNFFRRNFHKYGGVTAVMNPSKYIEKIHHFFGDVLIEDLDTPLFVQATDADTGDSEVLSEGLVYKAVYASGAIIPIFPPIEMNGKLLFDGVFSRGDPTSEMIKNGADIIISVQFDDTAEELPDNFPTFFMNFLRRCYHNYSNKQKALNIHTHHFEIIIVPIKFDFNVDIWDLDMFPSIKEKCKAEVDKYLPEIECIIQDFYRVNAG